MSFLHAKKFRNLIQDSNSAVSFFLRISKGLSDFRQALRMRQLLCKFPCPCPKLRNSSALVRITTLLLRRLNSAFFNALHRIKSSVYRFHVALEKVAPLQQSCEEEVSCTSDLIFLSPLFRRRTSSQQLCNGCLLIVTVCLPQFELVQAKSELSCKPTSTPSSN